MTFSPTVTGGNTLTSPSFAVLTNGEAVVYQSTGSGTTIGGLTLGQTYYVITAGSSTTIQLASSPGGAALSLTSGTGANHAFSLEPVSGGRVVYSFTTSAGATATTTFTFVPTASTVNATTNTITFNASPNFTNGEQVVYDNGGGTSIGGLLEGQTYFVKVLSPTQVQLFNNPALTGSAIALSLTGVTQTVNSLEPVLLFSGQSVPAQTQVLANNIPNASATSYALTAAVGGTNPTVSWNMFNQQVTTLSYSGQPQDTKSGILVSGSFVPDPIAFSPAGVTATSFTVTMLDQEGQTVRVANLPIAVQAYLNSPASFQSMTGVVGNTITFTAADGFKTGDALVYDNALGASIVAGSPATTYEFGSSSVTAGTTAVPYKAFNAAAPGVSGVNITFAAAPGFTNNQAVVYNNGGGNSISGLSNNHTYFVKTTGNARMIQLSLTSGGAAIALTAGKGTQSLQTATLVTAANVSAQTLTLNAANFSNGQAVLFNANGGNTFGLTDGGVYYVVGNTTTIQLALTKGGPAVALMAGVASNQSLSAAGSAITFASPHGLTTGQALTYENGGTIGIGGLTNSLTYYAIVVSPTTIRLALTPQNATSLVPVALTSQGGVSQSLTPTYYAIVTGTKTIKLAVNHVNALAGTAIGLTATANDVTQTLTRTGSINTPTPAPLSSANTASGAINSGITIERTQSGTGNAGVSAFTNANLAIYTSQYPSAYHLQALYTNPNGVSVAIGSGSTNPFYVIPAEMTIQGGIFAGLGQRVYTVTIVQSLRGPIRLVSIANGSAGFPTNQVNVEAFDLPLLGTMSSNVSVYYNGLLTMTASTSTFVPVPLKFSMSNPPPIFFSAGIRSVVLTPEDVLDEFFLVATTSAGTASLSTDQTGTSAGFQRFNLGRQRGR